jgi:uncharacterized protein YycO
MILRTSFTIVATPLTAVKSAAVVNGMFGGNPAEAKSTSVAKVHKIAGVGGPTLASR